LTDFALPLDELPDPLPIEPLAAPFDATITPPGSKSITNRVYLLAALSTGTSRVVRPLRSEDCDRLLEALCTLGAVARWDGADVEIDGVGGRFPRGGRVDLGDGGTPTRFMIAAACLAAEPVLVDGSPRMRERPIAEGVDMLRSIGARIEYAEAEGRLPVRIEPSNVAGGRARLGTLRSSQFISALQLIAPFLPEGAGSEIPADLPSFPYVLLTTDILAAWGIDAREAPDKPAVDLRAAWWIEPGLPAGRPVTIEPDASSAAYWAAAAALVTGARWRGQGLSLRSPQPDVRLLAFLRRAGASTEATADGLAVTGPERLAAVPETSCGDWPDGAMMAACVGAMLPEPTTLTGLGTLRVKESDRIAALAAELRKLGCTVRATDDAITIDPAGRHDEPVVIETYNDHRMAMAFAILGLVRPGVSIRDPRCVAKSYPGFWADLGKLHAAAGVRR
jgi:3-phosphoshikimate 1-carboxyvinyltransferase